MTFVDSNIETDSNHLTTEIKSKHISHFYIRQHISSKLYDVGTFKNICKNLIKSLKNASWMHSSLHFSTILFSSS